MIRRRKKWSSSAKTVAWLMIGLMVLFGILMLATGHSVLGPLLVTGLFGFVLWAADQEATPQR